MALPPFWAKLASPLYPPLVAQGTGPSRERGASTSVFLATAEDAALEAGLYWWDEAPKDPIPEAVDADAATRLWSESEHLVGLKD